MKDNDDLKKKVGRPGKSEVVKDSDSAVGSPAEANVAQKNGIGRDQSDEADQDSLLDATTTPPIDTPVTDHESDKRTDPTVDDVERTAGDAAHELVVPPPENNTVASEIKTHDVKNCESAVPEVVTPKNQKAIRQELAAEQLWKVAKGKLSKIVVIAAILWGGIYVAVKIARPMLVSFATWILRSDKDDEDDYYSREVSVEAERVISMTMPKHINTIGELKANASVVIHSEINGCIKKIHFVEGSMVKQGELLISLVDDIYQAEFRAHEAQYLATKAEFERLSKIRASGGSSNRELEKAQAEMNAAQAKMESSAAQLKRTGIRAPFDGKIGLIEIGEGTYVQPNQELVTIVDQTPIKVKFGVPGKFANSVGVGQAVELKVDAFKDRIFRGAVEAVDSYVDSSTNCVALRASIPNEDGALKAGLFASVSLVIGIQGETITVDESAVERIGEREYVWVVDRGKARVVYILTGTRERGRVEIIAGLHNKQIVVTSGQKGLSEGRFVKIVNMDVNSESPEREAYLTESPDKKA
jgi:membrane fusion protein (multidrug efflux system)